ncbi:peptide-methionine (S)-S-oxide reductase MsrA [Parvularcula maris]|uniref:Peptide methionine sulfoxide reductase MsrA n=1 Tax=Parvularcula maris TaxID=2965077 RepID=A0A9X2RJM3_9PROT|nr:peptide-methionine (S)-S-oxide reductase MsrA [Parvularcula maris]MCQ8184847.1 peptide-methionine (S)-S-oxide reductase MsrA [Parvularcula maris]
MLLPLLLTLSLAACGGDRSRPDVAAAAVIQAEGQAEALVAGGCFWCVESDLEKLDGVEEVVSGYGGGTSPMPTYKNYERGGHREVALVRYDPSEISYRELMAFFLRTIDVTDDGGQFCDRGYGYTTAVYYETEEEREILAELKAEAEREIGDEVVTPIEKRTTFTAAETYHQDYYKKKPRQYAVYRSLCGRDQTVRRLWGEAAGERLAAK